MKRAKLNKQLGAAEMAHKKSSAMYQEASQKHAEAKKLMKETKREFVEARRTHKAVRKAFRKLTESLKCTRREHLGNKERLQKLSKKAVKLGVQAEKQRSPVRKPTKKRQPAAMKPVVISETGISLLG